MDIKAYIEKEDGTFATNPLVSIMRVIDYLNVEETPDNILKDAQNVHEYLKACDLYA